MIDQIEAFYSKLSKNEQRLFLVAVLCFILFFVDVLFLGPILSHLKTMDIDIASKSAIIKRDLRILSFRHDILREYSQYTGYLDTGEKSQEEIVAALLHKIEVLAGEKSVSVSDVQPGDVKEGPVYKEYQTSIQGEGVLNNVLAFMYALEDSDYLFRITKYSLTPKSKGADLMKFTMDISRVLVSAEAIDEAELAKSLSAEAPPEVGSAAPAPETETPAVSSEPVSSPLPDAMPSVEAAAPSASSDETVATGLNEPFTESNPMTVTPSESKS